ncbi:MAG: glycoside hydrolase family 55 protein [Verrucomicrobia bacterium]|nr:glycoside hydrolase family 55 protein [Verrucomicrobiota bacterium]
MMRVTTLVTLLIFSVICLKADVRYPAGVVIDVTAAPYFADPTGVQDSRAALQQALDDFPGSMLERPILYFPNGLYRLSGGLVVDTHSQPGGGSGRGVVFQGQSQSGTVLRLDDNATGFGNVSAPAVFIDFNQANDVAGAWQYVAFQTHVKDMTIDIGAGNPGAIGLDFCANNVGGVRNVLIRSSDPEGAGHSGLLLSSIPGPQLLKNIELLALTGRFALARIHIMPPQWRMWFCATLAWAESSTAGTVSPFTGCKPMAWVDRRCATITSTVLSFW